MSFNKNPEVKLSVIIPLYNKVDYISDTIESVLSQSSELVEIIIVDDGSTDGSADVVQGYGHHIRYIRQDNAGPSAARNFGAYKASGEYLIFLDADDRLVEGSIDNILSVIVNEYSIDFVQGGFNTISPTGTITPSSLMDALPKNEVASSVHVKKFSSILCIGIPVGSFCVKKGLFDEIGGFSEELKCWEITDFLIRANLRSERYYLCDFSVLNRFEIPDNSQFNKLKENATFQLKYAEKLCGYLSCIERQEHAPHLRHLNSVLYMLLINYEFDEFRHLYKKVRVFDKKIKNDLIFVLPSFVLKALYHFKSRLR